MANILYYEPKTGTLFRHEPRERNVYAVKDTKKNRKLLSGRPLGQSIIPWLEEQERVLSKA
jgi:hypothetical protein